jgi:hypothetical protein
MPVQYKIGTDSQKDHVEKLGEYTIIRIGPDVLGFKNMGINFTEGCDVGGFPGEWIAPKVHDLASELYVGVEELGLDKYPNNCTRFAQILFGYFTDKQGNIHDDICMGYDKENNEFVFEQNNKVIRIKHEEC